MLNFLEVALRKGFFERLATWLQAATVPGIAPPAGIDAIISMARHGISRFKSQVTNHFLTRHPNRMAGEQSVDKSDLVAHEQSEAETQKSGSHRQTSIQPHKVLHRIGERKRDRGGNQHHSRDGSQSKNEQIPNGP